MIEVCYKFTCDKCKKVVEVPIQIGLGAQMPLPYIPIPNGWNVFNNDVLCNDHIMGIMEKFPDAEGR